MQMTLNDFGSGSKGTLHLPNLIKQRLLESFDGWLDEHRNVIGDNWYKNLKRELIKARTRSPTIPNVCGLAMWVFQSLSNLGVVASIGVDGYCIYELEGNFDEKSTKKVLLWCSEALKLMQTPKEVAVELGWI